MDKRTLSIILGLALLVSFFLEYLNNMSGIDLVRHIDSTDDKLLSLVWLVFPISGIMLLLGAFNRGRYPGGRVLWYWLPLLTLVFIIIAYPALHGQPLGDVFSRFGKGFGIGLWIALFASLIGVFASPRR